MELNEQTGNSVFKLGHKAKQQQDEQKAPIEGRNGKHGQFQTKGMVGITENAPKAKMQLQIDELSEKSEHENRINRLGSALNLNEDSEIQIHDSQLESAKQMEIDENLAKQEDDNLRQQFVSPLELTI